MSPSRSSRPSGSSKRRWSRTAASSTASSAVTSWSKTSALDVNCKAHEVDNLYVVDASFFVSSTAVNPGLTIMANALRVGDHLKERLG